MMMRMMMVMAMTMTITGAIEPLHSTTPTYGIRLLPERIQKLDVLKQGK